MASKAKTWRPVPDFKLYGRDSSYPEDSRHIRAIAGGAVLKIDYNFKRSMTVGLPDNIRLCELVEVDDPPTVPLEVWSAMNELYSVNPYHSAWRVILDWLTLTQMDAQDKEMTKE